MYFISCQSLFLTDGFYIDFMEVEREYISYSILLVDICMVNRFKNNSGLHTRVHGCSVEAKLDVSLKFTFFLFALMLKFVNVVVMVRQELRGYVEICVTAVIHLFVKSWEFNIKLKFRYGLRVKVSFQQRCLCVLLMCQCYVLVY